MMKRIIAICLVIFAVLCAGCAPEAEVIDIAPEAPAAVTETPAAAAETPAPAGEEFADDALATVAEGGYLLGLPAGVTAGQAKRVIMRDLEALSLALKNGEAELADTDVVYTGLSVVVEGTPYAELVILGDVNGDGLIDAADDAAVAAHTAGTTKLTGAFLRAAGYGEDGHELEAPDPNATPEASPTPDPDAKVTIEIPEGTPSSIKEKLEEANKKDPDVIGWVTVPGVNISYPIYNNDYNTKSKTFENDELKKVFSMADPDAKGPCCIMGHNLRDSKTMFHKLHHVQNAIMGVDKCQRCGESCTGLDVSASSKWSIVYGGHTEWKLFAMYETGVDEPEITLQYAALNSTMDKSDVSDWVKYQKMRSDHDFGVSVSSSDKIIVLITCGDDHGSGTQSRLYMCLKAVD